MESKNDTPKSSAPMLNEIVTAYREVFPLEAIKSVELEEQLEHSRIVLTVFSSADTIDFTRTWQVDIDEANKRDALVRTFRDTPTV